MRVIVAHNLFDKVGGAEVFYHEVYRVLSSNGHTVSYFSAQCDSADEESKKYFPPVAAYSEGGLISKIRSFPGAVYNKAAKKAMAKLIRDFKPDIIHVFAIYVQLTPSILDAAKEAGVPVVMSCNDYKHLCPNYKLYHHNKICEDCKGGKLYNAAINRCCHDSLPLSVASTVEGYIHNWLNIYRKNINTFLFASEFMAKKTEEFWGKGTVQIDYLRNPFDAHKYHVDANVGDYMLYFGRLIDEKGVHILMEAAALTPEVPVVVVGDGPDRAKLESRAKCLANVRIVGPAWGDELAQWLHGARVVVVPSLWHENFPYVILQAFAAAKPVIGSNRGGIPEMVEAGGFGWNYDALDAKALAATMRYAAGLADDKIARMGREVQDYVAREFNDTTIYQRLMDIYRSVLK